jgi:glycosyltransferase involved in cell wall biosynthesis
VDKSGSPLVSVVMPTFNRANLLHNVIASILEQDFRDLELLIVDDCSTDQTEQVIRALQEQDGRLRYHKLPENKGIGYARQAGLENVSGKYIALADSDDLWIAGKLKTQVDVLEGHPEIDILFGDYLDINHLTHSEIDGFWHTASGMKHLKTRPIQDHLYLIESGVETGILVADFIAVPTMIIRSTIFNTIGGFNVKLLSAADLEFGFRAAVLGAKFAYHDYPLIYRHIYSDSRTANTIMSNLRVIKSLAICRQLCDSIRQNDLTDAVEKALQRTYTYLMYAYGKAGDRDGVWKSYRNALAYGFAISNLVLFLGLMAGPEFISFTRRLRGLEAQ